MKRIIAIVLLCWSAGVMAEEVVLSCKFRHVPVGAPQATLVINLETKTVKYEEDDPVESYSMDGDHIIWIKYLKYGWSMGDLYSFVLNRLNGELRVATTSVDEQSFDDDPDRTLGAWNKRVGMRFLAKCFRSF